MSKAETKDSSSERKSLLAKDLKEGLEGLRDLLVAAFALVVTIADSIPRQKDSTAITSYEGKKPKPGNSIAIFDEEGNNSAGPEPVDISIEIDEKKRRKMAVDLFASFLYPILATISTTALIIGVVRIEPLTKWASTQNQCIETTNSVKGLDLPSRVMTCNGGHNY